MNLTIVLALVLALAQGESEAARTQREWLLKLHLGDALEYTMYRDASQKEKLEFRREPVYVWTNPVRVSQQDGSTQRLWDWSDNELSRCLVESSGYRALFGPAEANVVAAPAALPSNRPAAAAVSPVATASLDRVVKDNFSMALKSELSPVATASLDHVGCERIEGWAWDSQQPETPIAVDLYDGETLLTTVTANRFRRDLDRNHTGDGKHGFVFNTPARLKDAMTHQIHAKIAGPGIELHKSPQELACPVPSPR